METEQGQLVNHIEFLTTLSKRVYQVYHDHNALVEALNQLSQNSRLQLAETYQNTTGPVKSIRREVAAVLVKRNITKEELNSIIESAREQSPGSFSRMYKEWYNMLYMFVLADDRAKMNEAISGLQNGIFTALGHPDFLTSVKFDFTGERETGSIRTWMAFYNSTYKKQNTAKQLFINIENGTIFYSLYDRPSDIHTEQNVISDGEIFNADDIVRFFRSHLSEIEKDVSKTPITRISLNPGESVYKISMGPKDVDEDCYNFLTAEKFVTVNKDTKAIGQSYEKQGDLFVKELKVGDYIYLCRGNKMILIGRITGEAEPVAYDDWGEDGWMQRPFEIIKEAVNENRYGGDQKWWTPNFRSTCWPIPLAEIEQANQSLFTPFFETVFQLENPTYPSNNNKHSSMAEIPLNSILYGPPGTGKTYSTIAKAITVSNKTRIEGKKFVFPDDSHSKEGRAKIKLEYDRLVNEGFIVFTTFHQSMSYEDFIEGIKPKSINNQVVYEIQNGIFKEICNKARFISGNFISVIEKFKTDISEEDGKPSLTINATGTSFDVKYRGTTVFYVQPHSSVKENAWYPVNIDNIRKAFETENYKGIYNPTYVREIINYLKREYGLVKANREVHEVPENYILIIDEINRGNISQVFGELITLIEPDKREGKQEELDVILPYSKQSFSVPDNLYIIGTMNTADRSVEALDTALRRRFSFEFMPPKADLIPEIVGAIPLRRYFEVINDRVRFLLDQDHQIGHSYFMGISDEQEVKEIFKTKVIPLLKEYFYNDFGKIRLILGDGFVKKQENHCPAFAVTDNMELSRDVFTIVDIDEAFDISAALSKTLGKE